MKQRTARKILGPLCLATLLCLALTGCGGERLYLIEYDGDDGAGIVTLKTLGNIGLVSFYASLGLVYLAGIVASSFRCR